MSASGKPRSDTAWPPPVPAIPRGPREIAWTATLLLTVTLALWTPGGWYPVACTIAVTYMQRPWPRHLLSAALITAAAVTAISAATGGLHRLPHDLWHLMIRHVPPQPTPTEALHIIGAETTLALITVGIVLAYDTRRVTRGVADERLWQRQHHRRTQVLQADAATHPPPLVHT